MKVHIFIGSFDTIEEAKLYTQEYWEPEPDESISEEEYTTWEDNNPKWQMATDLRCYLDSDFIETVIDDKFDYLCEVVQVPKEILHLKSMLESKTAVLVLIFDKAIKSKNVTLESTKSISYKGCFESSLE